LTKALKPPEATGAGSLTSALELELEEEEDEEEVSVSSG
jgi:hypothetical protein